MGDLVDHIRWHVDAIKSSSSDENRPAHLHRRCLQLDHEPGAEALSQARLELGQFLGTAIGAHHELTAGVEQHVEGVEELLARLCPPREELDVVYQHHVGPPKALLEASRSLAAYCFDELARELLDRGVAHLEPYSVSADVVADGMQQVRLANARRPMEEQRVVGLRRQLGHRQRSGVSEPVSLPDHKLVEGVLGVQPPTRRPAGSLDRKSTRLNSSHTV